MTTAWSSRPSSAPWPASRTTTSHGAYKFTAAQCTRNEKGILVPPPLRFDVLEEITKRLPGFPIVLHGSSSVPQNYVAMINANGGKMPDAVGIPEEQLRQAARSAVCKINIDSDLRLAMTGTIREYMAQHPDHFDPRQYLKPARANIKELVRHKLVRSAPVPEARPRQHQGARPPQAGERPRLRRQGLIPHIAYHRRQPRR